MNVYVPTDTKFYRSGEGGVLPSQPIHTTDFWLRYLDVFDRVTFSGRILKGKPQTELPLATNERIVFLPIDSDSGAWPFLRSIFFVLRKILKDRESATCLRMPTLTSSLVGIFLILMGRPFGVEVVGDPADALNNRFASTIRLRWALRWFLVVSQKVLCRAAIATAYVSERSLQVRYPPRNKKFTTHFSSIEMTDDFFCPFKGRQPDLATRLIHVGSMGKVLYKGQDNLLDAVLLLLPKYPDLQLTLVGGGAGLATVQKKAESLGISDRVEFAGHVSSKDELRTRLDNAHLFVFPSLTEGLPKALIEGMARGLPAIASDVGGNGELLGANAIVPAGDVNGLAEKLDEFIGSRALREAESARNYSKALEYHIDQIRPRRIAYYREVFQRTLSWKVVMKAQA